MTILFHFLDWPPEVGQCVIVIAIIVHFFMVRRIYWRSQMQDQKERAEIRASIETGFTRLYQVITTTIQAAQDQTPSQKQAFPPDIND